MNTVTFPISPRVAEQAARDYVIIVSAGAEHQLERAVQNAVEAHGYLPRCQTSRDWDEYYRRRLDRWRDGSGWYMREPYRHAEALAEMLDCHASAVAPYVVPTMMPVGLTRREIVLQVLRDMAARIQREERQAARSARRASA